MKHRQQLIVTVGLSLQAFAAQAALTSYTNAEGTALVYSSLGGVSWSKDANLLGTLNSQNGNHAFFIMQASPIIYDTPNRFDTPANSGYHNIDYKTDFFLIGGGASWFGAKAFTNYLNINSYGGIQQWALPTQTAYQGLLKELKVSFNDSTFPATATFDNKPTSSVWLAEEYSINLSAALSGYVPSSSGVDPKNRLLGIWAVIPSTTVQIGNGGTTGAIIGNAVDIPNLVFNRSDGVTYGGVISGAGTVAQNGSGTLILNGNNTYRGTTEVNAGTLRVGSANALGNSAGLSVNGGTLDVGSNRINTGEVNLASGRIIGTGRITASRYDVQAGEIAANLDGRGFTKTDDGKVILSGINTWTGGTSLNGGTLAVSSDSNLGDISGGLTFRSGTLEALSSFSTSRAMSLQGGGGLAAASGQTLTANGVISGSGGLTKTGDGDVILAGANTYSGGTFINGGTLSISTDNKLGASGGALTFNGGTLKALSPVNTSRTMTLQANGGGFAADGTNAITANGVISGSGGLTKTGTGGLILTSANTYTGGTFINAGILALRTPNALADTGAVTVNGGLFDVGTSTETVGAVTLNNGRIEGPGTLVGSAYNVQAGNMLAKLAGNGALTKASEGTVIIKAANTYTGGTFVNAGTLTAGSSNILADTGALTVNGGTFNLASFSDTVGAVTLTSGSIIGSGTLTGTGYNVQAGTIGTKLAGSGALTKTTGGTVTLSGVNTYTGGTNVNAGTLSISANNLLADTGALTVNGGAFNLGIFSDSVGAFTLNNGTVSGTGTLTAASYKLAAGTINAKLGGSGALTKSGTGTVQLTNTNTLSGQVKVEAGTLQLDNGLSQAGGQINILGGANLAAKGAINRNLIGSGTVRATGNLQLGDSSSAAGVNFNGTIDAGSQVVTLMGAGQAHLGGTVKLGAGGRLASSNPAPSGGIDLTSSGVLNASAGNANVDGYFHNNGLVQGASAAGQLLKFNNDVAGAGGFTGNIAFVQGYNPGNSPAAIDFGGGNVSFDSTSVLNMEIFGQTPGSQYDTLTNINQLDFNGSLTLTFGNGYTPLADDMFNLFNFNVFSGIFDINKINVIGFDKSALDFSRLAYDGSFRLAPPPVGGGSGGGTGHIPTPVPGAVWLFGSALLGFAGLKRQYRGWKSMGSD